MGKTTIASKVKKYFASNLSRKEVYATSDGFLFEQEQNAKAHSKTLKDKKVETYAKSVEVASKEKDAQKASAKGEADKNTAGETKHPANTGADQKTAK